MTTLVPSSSSQNQQQQPGTTVTTSTGVESYEDMFKEITRKLYGEESAHGLYPINNSQVAQLAQTPSAPPEGERSFTTLVSDRNLAQLEYEGVIQTDTTNNFKSEDHLSTAFGLAALMHNGFPPPAVFPVTTNPASKQGGGQTNGDDRQWTQQQQTQPQQDDQIWNANKTTYTQKLFKIKTKQEPQTSEIILNTSNGNVANVKSEIQQIQKRYSCSVCPYSTDRRDLFTRHENIHKEEKPFHCFACLKQFNRADHVKKHFLRMHRELEYDINKTRRYPPSSKQALNSNNSSTTSNNHSSNNNNNNSNNNNNNKSNNNTFFYNQQPTAVEAQVSVPTTINIPTFSHQHQVSNITNNSNNNNNANTHHHNSTTSQHHSIEQVIQQSSSNNQQNGVNNQVTSINIKHEKSIQGKSPKIKGEKRFMCCYCPWSGSDNWGLKRHLNTHTKPFVCLLCDYKAARSERLTTHILKVHNKKACNKCSFFADDQAQLTQHQIDSHQNETRVNNHPRINNPTNNNPAQTIVTNQNINNQPTSSSVINPVAANISASTGNVLRTLTNTLVPNIHTTASNHVFGTLNSSLSNGVSTIYTTSNVNTNIVEQINHHLASTNNWRTINTNPTSVSLNINTIPNSSNANNNNSSNNNNNTLNNPVIRSQQTANTLLTFTNPTALGTHSSSISKRKSGADRLFAYFEADDSEDFELDYARQLQMQALSRNTASVAQDFPNAGGDTPKKQQLNKGVITVKSCKDINSIINRDINELYGAIGLQQQKLKAAMSPIDHSPPASDNTNNNYIKRRRKSSSSNDKENVNELLTKQLTFLKQQHQMFLVNLNASIMSDSERLKAITEINEIFAGMFRSSLSIISSMENEKFYKLQQQPKIKQEPLVWDDDDDENNSGGNEENEVQNYILPAFLRNNKEITVIRDIKNFNRMKDEDCQPHQSQAAESDDASHSCSGENRKNRKQLKPKKIEKDIEDGDCGKVSKSQQEKPIKQSPKKHAPSLSSSLSLVLTSTASNINNLRDKHMLKLVTKKQCCYVCRNKSIDANSYDTRKSLLLHNLWRHSPKVLECHRCQTKFNRIYKLKLHKTLKRH